MKKGDFIEIEFTGKIKEGDFVFDTTNEKTAKEKGIFDQKKEYGSVVISVGLRQVLPGLDDELLNKNIGDEFDVEIPAEKGFGKRDAKLIQLIGMPAFKKHKVNPYPGLQVNIDNHIGVVKSVNGGRVIVDFNHPLAGQDLIYHVKILRKIEDDKEKVKEFVSIQYGLPKKTLDVFEKEGKIVIKFPFPQMEDKIKQELIKQVKEAVNTSKEIVIELQDIEINSNNNNKNNIKSDKNNNNNQKN